jgi:hypothetical protein
MSQQVDPPGHVRSSHSSSAIPKESAMREVARRSFLAQAAVVGAAATIAGAAPLLLEEHEPLPTLPNRLPESLVVHVRDLRTGEISVMADTDEVIYRDARLVASILQALARGTGR